MTHISLEANLKALRLPTFLKEYAVVAKESVQKNASYEEFLKDLSEKELINKHSNARSCNSTLFYQTSSESIKEPIYP